MFDFYVIIISFAYRYNVRYNVTQDIPGLFRLDITDKVLHILIEPCRRENILNTYIVLLVTLYHHTILVRFYM